MSQPWFGQLTMLQQVHTYEFTDNSLKIVKDIGVVVKEYRKLANCGIIKPVIAKPEPVEVRDPKKLTDDDKKKIDAAIRQANMVNGTSKMPDGTGFIDTPALIEFDPDGNVRIISPNDAEVTWNNGEPLYEKMKMVHIRFKQVKNLGS